MNDEDGDNRDASPIVAMSLPIQDDVKTLMCKCSKGHFIVTDLLRGTSVPSHMPSYACRLPTHLHGAGGNVIFPCTPLRLCFTGPISMKWT